MRKILLAAAVIGSCLASCSKEVPPLSRQEMNQKIDSIIKASTEESDARARLDLDRRMKIEVKVKADSILNARLHPNAAVKPAPSIRPTVPMPIIKGQTKH